MCASSNSVQIVKVFSLEINNVRDKHKLSSDTGIVGAIAM